MNEGARQANEELHRRSLRDANESQNAKLNRIIELLEKLVAVEQLYGYLARGKMIKVKKWMLSDGEYGDLNPPLENVRVIGKEIWYQWIDDPKWLAVGYIPTPASVIGWFFYHLIHGIWMKYPLWAIILYCLDKDNYPSREAVEQSRAADGAKRSVCKHNFDYGLYCSKCGEAQF